MILTYPLLILKYTASYNFPSFSVGDTHLSAVSMCFSQGKIPKTKSLPLKSRPKRPKNDHVPQASPIFQLQNFAPFVSGKVKSMVVSGSLNRWDRYHIIAQLAVTIPLIVLANWVIIWYRSHLLREPETTIDKIPLPPWQRSASFLRGRCGKARSNGRTTVSPPRRCMRKPGSLERNKRMENQEVMQSMLGQD